MPRLTRLRRSTTLPPLKLKSGYALEDGAVTQNALGESVPTPHFCKFPVVYACQKLLKSVKAISKCSEHKVTLQTQCSLHCLTDNLH